MSNSLVTRINALQNSIALASAHLHGLDVDLGYEHRRKQAEERLNELVRQRREAVFELMLHTSHRRFMYILHLENKA
jgi:hypothetical protein